MAIVVDASAMVFALLGTPSQAGNLRQRLAAETCHAPHLIDAEVGNALRRIVLRGVLDAVDGELLLHASRPLIDYRYEVDGGLARSAWRLREHVSFYDGLYAALAASLGVPLLTADGRLARARRLGCRVERVYS